MTGPSGGSLVVVGTGPGKAELMTPATETALARATDLVGYGPYLDRVPPRSGQCRHASDNRVELERARHALSLAAAGRQVVVVSGGDPGVFAMASAIFEAVETGEPAWRALDIRVEAAASEACDFLDQHYGSVDDSRDSQRACRNSAVNMAQAQVRDAVERSAYTYAEF